MYCLSDEQIEYILNEIKHRGIEMEDLQLNLLDHICCIIEQNLKNEDFEIFYKQNIRLFYNNELREIEEETINLLTFKNYYTMKKIMIVSGSISTVAFIIGSFFKIMFWPGATFLLFLAFIVFSLVFLPLLCVLKIKEVNTMRDKIILVLGVSVGILYCISMWTQLVQWPGKHLIWLATLAISFFVFIPVYFFTGLRRPETRVNTIVSTIVLVAVIGIQFTMTGLRSPIQNKINVHTNADKTVAQDKVELIKK